MFHPLFSPNMDELLNYLETPDNLISDPLFGEDIDNLLDYLKEENSKKKKVNKKRKEIKKITNLEEELYVNVEKCLSCYTLGKKNIIGLRQILINKYGESWVNKFNKIISSKSYVWHYYNKNFMELLKKKSNRFILVIKKSTNMFYICQNDNIPPGYRVYKLLKN